MFGYPISDQIDGFADNDPAWAVLNKYALGGGLEIGSAAARTYNSPVDDIGDHSNEVGYGGSTNRYQTDAKTTSPTARPRSRKRRSSAIYKPIT
jgi:hypothetical protein